MLHVEFLSSILYFLQTSALLLFKTFEIPHERNSLELCHLYAFLSLSY